MYLKHKTSGDMVEILAFEDLVNPTKGEVEGRFHAGEELQEVEIFSKSDLLFPSNEELPRCWVDSHYRDDKIQH